MMDVVRPRVAVIGAGWAGLAAAMTAVAQGAQVTVLEASRQPGGRARSLQPSSSHEEASPTLDNGQHILIGAYSECLRLMQWAGVDPENALLRLPLQLLDVEGAGLRVRPQLPYRWLPDKWLRAGEKSPQCLLLAAILGTRHWNWGDKMSLLQVAWRWQRHQFSCPPSRTVAQICAGLSPRIMRDLIEPLCLSALNTAPEQASAQVFLRVMQDGLYGPPGASDLLIPRVGLSALWPQAACEWLQNPHSLLQHMSHQALPPQPARVLLGQRVQALEYVDMWDEASQSQRVSWAIHWGQTASTLSMGGQTSIQREVFDHVILACPAWESLRLLRPLETHDHIAQWCQITQQLRFEPIGTVYMHADQSLLTHPMLTLRSSAQAPAQFVFNRAHLGAAPGDLAFVASACGDLNNEELTYQVVQQAQTQLQDTGWVRGLTVQKTVIEKRATFVCSADLQRPPASIAPKLWAAADYVEGPYPATLEGAVRSGVYAARQLQ